MKWSVVKTFTLLYMCVLTPQCCHYKYSDVLFVFTCFFFLVIFWHDMIFLFWTLPLFSVHWPVAILLSESGLPVFHRVWWGSCVMSEQWNKACLFTDYIKTTYIRLLLLLLHTSHCYTSSSFYCLCRFIYTWLCTHSFYCWHLILTSISKWRSSSLINM